MRYRAAPVRRRPDPRDRPVIGRPRQAADLLLPEMQDLPQEQVRVLLLDTRNRLVGQQVVYLGNAWGAEVRPAEVFRPAVLEGAPRVLLAHNHPSGDPEPSPEDIAVTASLLRAGEVLGIHLVDHIVLGHGRFVSLRERGLPRGIPWPP